MVRTREALTTHETGNAYLVPLDVYFYGSLPNDYAIVQDGGPGFHKDQYFYVEKILRSGGVLNGPSASWMLNNMPVDRYGFGVHQDPNRVWHSTDEQIAVKMLAETNPSAPIVDIGSFGAEMTDLPHLLYTTGRTLIEKLAVLNLKYRFEIKPLVYDTFSILNFMNNTRSRFRELKRMRESGIKKAKATIEHRRTSTRTRNVLLNTAWGVGVSADEIIQWDSRKWAYTEWRVDDDFPSTDGELLKAAFLAANGLIIDFSTAWNRIPWTWMIDWYADVGSLLLANRNIVGASHGPCYVCHTERSQLDNTNVHVDRPSVKYTPFRCEMITKKRTLVNPTLSASLPMFSDGQISILTSLSILNKKR